MAVRAIIDEHHVVRHCKKRILIRDGQKVISVFPEAFYLRPASVDFPKEDYLSGVYYEFFAGEDQIRMKACCAALPLKKRPKDGLMRLNVGLVKEQGRKRDKKLRVTHEPERECPAYATIRGLPEEADDQLASLLATFAVIELVEVSEVM